MTWALRDLPLTALSFVDEAACAITPISPSHGGHIVWVTCPSQSYSTIYPTSTPQTEGWAQGVAEEEPLPMVLYMCVYVCVCVCLPVQGALHSMEDTLGTGPPGVAGSQPVSLFLFF